MYLVSVCCPCTNRAIAQQSTTYSRALHDEKISRQRSLQKYTYVLNVLPWVIISFPLRRKLHCRKNIMSQHASVSRTFRVHCLLLHDSAVDFLSRRVRLWYRSLPSSCRANSGGVPLFLQVQVRGARQAEEPLEGVGVGKHVDHSLGRDSRCSFRQTLQVRHSASIPHILT